MGTVLYVLAETIRHLAVLIQPFMPSSASIAPSARPVKPMPVSARNVRLGMRPQGGVGVAVGRRVMGRSPWVEAFAGTIGS